MTGNPVASCTAAGSMMLYQAMTLPLIMMRLMSRRARSVTIPMTASVASIPPTVTRAKAAPSIRRSFRMTMPARVDCSLPE